MKLKDKRIIYGAYQSLKSKTDDEKDRFCSGWNITRSQLEKITMKGDSCADSE